MVSFNLAEGRHIIQYTLSGYETLTFEIDVNSAGNITCVSGSGYNCNSTSRPGVMISGTTVTGYMKAGAASPTPTGTVTPTPTQVNSYSSWVSNHGGSSGLIGNTIAVNEILDAYIGITYLGFNVSTGDVSTTLDYYLGLV